ncbi:neuropeptides capa receptor-like [Patiria miniata]|uniref:G-protein coupled receptors family 1 profile domain-containing protein n=1 Tax=Patiria miniata TaxID=46514 RepID=A0A913ZTL4_PATMI|nr:neuropeptides capa receptor-like [Patiria miniata]
MDATPSSLSCTGDEEWDYSNLSVPSGLLHNPTDTAIITIVNPCILALGLTGNLAFLFVMVRVSRMWNVTNIYLINMAVADTAFLTVAVSEKLASYYTSPIKGDRSAFGPAGCIITFVLLDLSYFASVFLVTLVSLEKFYAICRPVKHRIIGGKKRTTRLVVGAWLLALAFALALLPAWVVYVKICTIWPATEEYRDFPRYIGQCNAITEWYDEFHNGFQTVPFFLALVSNLVFYVKIIQRLSTRVSSVSPERSARNAKRQKVRNQVAVMLIANGVAFFVCLAPFQLTSFSLTISGLTGNYLLTPDQINTLVWVARIFTYINPVINPVIYNLTNKRYRTAFYEAFTCQALRKRQDETTGINEDTVSTFNT